MATKINTTYKVHQLFKAFYEHDVQKKKEVCEELRDLIKEKTVKGKGSIQELLDDKDTLDKECSKDLVKAINVVTDTMSDSDLHVVNINNKTITLSNKELQEMVYVVSNLQKSLNILQAIFPM